MEAKDVTEGMLERWYDHPETPYSHYSDREFDHREVVAAAVNAAGAVVLSDEDKTLIRAVSRYYQHQLRLAQQGSREGRQTTTHDLVVLEKTLGLLNRLTT